MLFRSGAGSTQVRVGVLSNHTYTVQRSDKLAGGAWTRLADIISLPVDRTETLVDTGVGTNRFYRLISPRQ